MKKYSFLPILALVLGIAASAFTVSENQNSDLVWFEVDQQGQAINSSTGGTEGVNPPMNCPGGSLLCARALSISQGEVVDNHDGTYGIATGVDISFDYDDSREKNQ